MDRRWLLAVAVAFAAVLAGMWWGRGVQPVSPPQPLTSTTPEAPGSTPSPALVVHVSGWVAEPGLVTLPSGSRVGDAVAGAGGARPGARLEAMNLAATVTDGQQVVVPGPGDAEKPGGPDDPSGDSGGLIDLNGAAATDLESLPGVGPVLAERIVQYRDAHGPFQRVEDLLEVSGIGESKLGSIRDLVVLP